MERNAPGNVPAIGASARVAPQHCPILSPDSLYCLSHRVKVNHLLHDAWN
jgi:hypothetical protein